MWAHSRPISDGDLCVICGCENPNVLEKHHKIPSRYGGTDRDENLVTLCANCHAAVERIYNDDFWSRVEALDFSDRDPDPEQHRENLQWYNGSEQVAESVSNSGDDEQTEVKNNNDNDDCSKDLEEMACQIVSEGDIDKVTTENNKIAPALLEYEFDVSGGETQLLKRLIEREQSKTSEKAEIPIEARDRIISQLSDRGVTQQTIASVFSLTQPTVSKICNGQARGETEAVDE